MENSLLPDTLVSTEWLAAHLGADDLAIVDIRGAVVTADLGEGRQSADYVAARDEYDEGHLPGAVFVDWTVDVTDPDNPIKAQIAPPERFAEAMASRGIGDETDVVIVDHTGGHFATRLWWALKFYGHDRSAVLDGGFRRWVAEGRPIGQDVPRPLRKVFTPSVRPELRVDAPQVLKMIGAPDSLIVDARDAAQYRGETVRGSRGGHLPGAVHIPARALFNEDGTWKPIDEQRRLLEEGGIQPDQTVAAYCNGGVTATAVLFALHRTGHQRFANYDGSWNEWAERNELPVEQVDGSPDDRAGVTH
jgi:thiosulfate/3-mercaptopyruvate sulfurtransferase